MRTSIRAHLCMLFAFALQACGASGGTDPDATVGDGALDAAMDARPTPTDGGLGDFEGLGDPCETGDDCPSGFCADRGGRSVCTARCEGACPSGWSCRVIDVRGELVSLCAPVIPRSCTPCTDDTQCPGGACVPVDGDELYCVPLCFEGSCEGGTECAPHPAEDRDELVCLPHSCTCTEENAGTVRTCTTENEIGTCFGVETCEPSVGWTGCDARTAAPEQCDGTDNDCNSLIDDGVDGSPCENAVAGVGSCPGVTLCLGAAGLICQGQTPMPEVCNYVDDNCNGEIDEGFPGLGDVCSAGVGGCQRYGVVRCTADELGTECSATAGAPQAERCNGRDDDCDGLVDEDFPELGNACTAGEGICERIGGLVCRADGLGTECSADPGPPRAEVCNNLDDDCNGVIDDGFRDPVTGLYTAHTACGSCGVDCTRIYDLPNAFGTCVVSGGVPGCRFNCAPGAYDLNGALPDGCEFILEDVIYVSGSDPGAVDNAGCGLGPIGTGPGRYPCRTIARGLARAGATGRTRVLVANAIYDEPVALVSGISLLGGYRWDTWERDVGSTNTQIQGVEAMGAHDVTVRAVGIVAPTVFEGFVVRGAVNGRVGGNSYAVYVASSNANLVLRQNVIFGGRGGPGASGLVGVDGSGGAEGIGRGSPGVSDSSYDAHVTTGTAPCASASNDRQYANGAVGTCGGGDVSGGRGGGNRCRPVIDDRFSALPGLVGQAAVGGGAGGPPSLGGLDARLYPIPGYLVCSSPQNAEDGLPGAPGMHGGSGAGCALGMGTVSGAHWTGSAAGIGGAGAPGGGGGGGGAGGGGRCDGCPDGRDRIGAHGGGGGAGGCGGGGGSGASAGGAAFGVFIAGGAAPTITTNTIVRGEGGVGGNGGSGGIGGLGGTGAAGGTSTVFCAGRAGRGGNGGDGGVGGGGGGGCGGPSVGIFSSGVGDPGYCAAGPGNVVSGGAGGAGGAGGFSLVSPGAPGAPGAMADCTAL